MLFRSSIFVALVATVSAAMRNTAIQPEDFEIPANSRIGKKLLSSARRLENNNNQNQDADFLAGFSIRYDSCSSLIQIREEGGNQDEGLLYTQNLVKFSLCNGNSDGCSGCGNGAGQYVVNMMDFIDAYTEMKLEEQEYACEMIREYCYCDNANDDQVCENQCYADAGMDVCIEYEGGDEFEIQRYLECAEMEGADGNNNNNNGNGNYYNNNNNNNNGVDMYRQYYIGPICSPNDGKSIHMSVFYDAGCTSQAPTGVYEAFHYGQALPFESEAIVTLNDCISCLQVDENQNQNQNNNNNNNNNNNQNYNYNQNQNMEALELCQQSYEMAAKCEENLSQYVGQYYYTDTTGCEYINNILPKLEKATRKISSVSAAGGGSAAPAATAFAVIFAVTSLILGAYAFFLYRKIHRAKVNLAQAEMGIA